MALVGSLELTIDGETLTAETGSVDGRAENMTDCWELDIYIGRDVAVTGQPTGANMTHGLKLCRRLDAWSVPLLKAAAKDAKVTGIVTIYEAKIGTSGPEMPILRIHFGEETGDGRVASVKTILPSSESWTTTSERPAGTESPHPHQVVCFGFNKVRFDKFDPNMPGQVVDCAEWQYAKQGNA